MSGASKLTGGFDVNVSLFLKEVFEKEYKTRLLWFEKNYKKVYESRPPEQIPKKGKVLYDEIVRRRIHDQIQSAHRIVPKYLPALPKTDPSVDLLPDMRPVPPKESALLIEGSEAFLKQRYKTSPDKRYYYPATTNWNYGWLVGRMPIKSIANQIHGRKNIIKATFYRRNGVQPDRSYYRMTTSNNFDFPFI